MVEQWNSGTEMVEQCNSDYRQRKSYSGTVEKRWWNSGTVIMEQRNSYGGTAEQRW